MTPTEQALTAALGKARAEITRLRLVTQAHTTSRADLDNAIRVGEAQAWLDRIGTDPDAAAHRIALADAIYAGSAA